MRSAALFNSRCSSDHASYACSSCRPATSTHLAHRIACNAADSRRAAGTVIKTTMEQGSVRGSKIGMLSAMFLPPPQTSVSRTCKIFRDTGPDLQTSRAGSSTTTATLRTPMAAAHSRSSRRRRRPCPPPWRRSAGATTGWTSSPVSTRGASPSGTGRSGAQPQPVSVARLLCRPSVRADADAVRHVFFKPLLHSHDTASSNLAKPQT